MDNAEEFARTRRAMSIVGITEAQQDSVWRIVAAVLHLGNVKFAGEEEAKFADEASEEAVRAPATLMPISIFFSKASEKMTKRGFWRLSFCDDRVHVRPSGFNESFVRLLHQSAVGYGYASLLRQQAELP